MNNERQMRQYNCSNQSTGKHTSQMTRGKTAINKQTLFYQHVFKTQQQINESLKHLQKALQGFYAYILPHSSSEKQPVSPCF